MGRDEDIDGMDSDLNLVVATGAQPEIPAGILLRMGAYMVDISMLAGAVLFTQLGIHFLSGGFQAHALKSGWQIEAWVLGTVSLPIWAYFTLLERSGWQATLGKRLAALQVTDTAGGRIGLGRAFLRTIVKLLPWELTHLSLLVPTPMWSAGATAGIRPGLVVADLLLIGYIAVAALTPRKQSVHDLVAGTMVAIRRFEKVARASQATGKDHPA
jgi:uncharacterized RDD family membrane protein YckC